MGRIGIVLGLLLGMQAGVGAHAANCVAGTLESHFTGADAVAIGRVEGVKTLDAAGGAIEAQVTVERQWKGDLPPQIRVVTDSTVAVELEAGQRYLLYLEALPTGGYSTNRCNGTAEFSLSRAAVEWLDDKMPPKAG